MYYFWDEYKKWIIGLVVLIFIAASSYFVIQSSVVDRIFFSLKGDITSDVKKDSDAFKDQDEANYLVLFYDFDTCLDCEETAEEVKVYQGEKDALPVYKVKTDKLSESQFENELFFNPEQPLIVHVKENEEFFRYIGTFPVENLPTKDSDGMAEGVTDGVEVDDEDVDELENEENVEEMVEEN